MHAKKRSKMNDKSFHHDCQSNNTFKEQKPLAYFQHVVSLSLPATELYTHSSRLLHIVQYASLFRVSTNIIPAHRLSDSLRPIQYKQYSASPLDRTSPSQLIVNNRLLRSLRKSPPQSINCPKFLQLLTYTFSVSASLMQPNPPSQTNWNRSHSSHLSISPRSQQKPVCTRVSFLLHMQLC